MRKGGGEKGRGRRKEEERGRQEDFETFFLIN